MIRIKILTADEQERVVYDGSPATIKVCYAGETYTVVLEQEDEVGRWIPVEVEV